MLLLVTLKQAKALSALIRQVVSQLPARLTTPSSQMAMMKPFILLFLTLLKVRFLRGYQK